LNFSAQKLDSQNELFESNENDNNNYHNNEYTQEREERESIANSFDAIVNVIRQYKNDVAKPDDSKLNEITVPDTVNIGFNADTFLTDVRVKGLQNLKSQNITMIWGEDLVSMYNNSNMCISIPTQFIDCSVNWYYFTGKIIFNSGFCIKQ